MPSNRLILRKMDSPWRTQHMDITRGTTLTHADLDNNFIFLKGEIIDSARLDGETLKLTKICGADIELNLSGLTQNNEDSLRNVEDVTDGIRDDLDTNVTIINNTINEIKDGIEANTIWEWGSDGIKSIKVKNGSNNDATGDYSVSEGYNTKATGDFSVSEGYNTKATGDFSNAEGSNTTASGRASHAGGASSYANGDFSFAHSKESKADGESSVVLGGNLNGVEGGGENSGVLLGDTNRILGLDYQKLINDTENEIKILESEREKEHADFISLENDLKEQLNINREQIKTLKNEIEELNYEISDLEFKKSELEAIEPRTDGIVMKINEITLVINDLRTLVAQKEKELAALESEASQLKVEIEEAIKKENEAQEVYEENRSRLEKLLDEYNKALYEFDGYLPKQSTILGGSSNIINSASESVIDGGSGNTITSKVKNSGIFGGSKNELGGGTYIDLIARLEEELRQRAEEKAKYDADTEKLIKSLQSNIADKEKQLQDEKQQQPQDLGLIATLEADIKELKEEKKVLEEELSRNNEEYVEYVNETNVKIEEYKAIEYAKYGEVPSTVITPIDGASLIAGSGNKIINLSDNSSIIGGKSNLIDNAYGSVILGGEGITATNNNTVYTPNLNIDIQPANDNSLTQVLVRDGDGNVKYKDVASFTDLSIVSGVYDIRTGVVTFINNDGDSFEISGFTSGMTDSYTTEAYLEDKTIYFNNNIKGDDIYSVDISPILGDVIAAVGYNNRSECSIKSYNEYQALAENYTKVKNEYDTIQASKQEIDTNIAELEVLITTAETKVNEYETERFDTLEPNLFNLEAERNDLMQQLDDLINAPGEDLFDRTKAMLAADELIGSVDNIGTTISQKGEMTDAEFFATYYESIDEDLSVTLSTLQYIDNLIITNVSGDYIGKTQLRSIIAEINVLIKRLRGFLENGEYQNLKSRQAQLRVKVEELRDGIESVEFFPPDNSEEIAALEQQIQVLNQQIQDIKVQIQIITEQIVSLDKQLSIYYTQRESYIKDSDRYEEQIQIIEASGDLEFISFMPVNEVNFNCWLRYEIIKSVGYEDRGECSYKMYALYENLYQKSLQEQAEINKLESEKAKAQEIRNQEHADYISEKNQLEDALSNEQDELNILKQIENPTQEELSQIAILEFRISDIESQLKVLTANEEKAVKSYTEYISFLDGQINQWYSTSLRADESGYEFFQKYTPLNEANFTCWRDMYFHEIQEDEINNIITTIGYNDRGICSLDSFTKYRALAENYTNTKNEYDTLQANKQDTQTTISELKSQLADAQSQVPVDQQIVDQLSAEIAQNEEDLAQTNAQIQEIEATGDLDFVAYMPINEVNFNCWVDAEQELFIKNEVITLNNRIDDEVKTINKTTDEIIYNVGYDDRGVCSLDSFTEYRALAENYTTLKNEYDTLQTNKQDLETTIADLKSQLVNAETQEERDIINAQIQKNEEDLKQTLAQIEEIEATGDLDFVAYMPVNEANFNCWVNAKQTESLTSEINITNNNLTEQVEIINKTTDEIIYTVGYNNRGECSGEQYATYENEVNLYYDSKEAYDEYDSNIQTLTDEITQLKSDIDTLETEINTLERTILLGKLDGIDQTENKNLKNQKQTDLNSKQAELEQKAVERERDIDRQEQIIDSGVLEFAPYVPANETNFNCWVNQGIIDSVGYDDRGTCDSMSYHLYQQLVHQLKHEQSQYNEIIIDKNETTETRREENKNFLKEHAVMTDNIDFYQRILKQINQTIEDEGRDATPEELGKIAILEQLINDLIKNREDLVTAETIAKKAYEDYIAAYKEWIINFENNTKPDIDRYLPENEVNYSCWRNELFYENAQSQRDAIISAVGYDDRGSCSEEQYTSYESEVNQYYSSKEAYDEYDSNIQTLTDEITDLESSKTTKESELSTKQNELLDIIPGSAFIIANYEYIISVNQQLSQDVNSIKSLMMSWGYGKTETEFLTEKKSVESLITLSLESWNMLNDLMVVNTTFNYQNKDSITIALTNIKNSLDSTQTILGTMTHTDTEQVFSQNKTDIVNHVDSAIVDSNVLQHDVTFAKNYYVQTNNDLKNDIEQLQQDIESLSADIEQKQVQKEYYVDSKQQIIDSGALEFEPYVPANEANFNCWVNAKQTESLTSEINITNNNLTEQVEIINKTINEVVNNVGYDDRGDCSSKLFTEYRALAEQYISTKTNYDNLQTSKQGLQTNIAMLEEQLATSQSSSEPVDQERIDNLTAEIAQNEEDLAQINAQILSIERSGDLDFAPYVPINEVNFICWVNNIEAVEPSIYNLETHLIDAMDDGRKGTFNYYPNIFDEFTENPTFIIGEFDDLDKIINISDGSKLTWAKAVVKSQWDNGVDMGNPLMSNLEISVNVLERLKSAIISAESVSQGEYDAIKVNYEDMYAVLELENNTNGTDLDLYELQVKIQNLSDERQNEKEVNEYMVGKITEAIKVYELIINIAKDEIEIS